MQEMGAAHELIRLASSRGDRGKRTTFYGYCSCGYGVPSSVSPTAVQKKHAAHVASVSGQTA